MKHFQAPTKHQIHLQELFSYTTPHLPTLCYWENKNELDTKIPEITQKVKEDLQFPNIGRTDAQMKVILLELENLRNQSMQYNSIIKSTQENSNEK